MFSTALFAARSSAATDSLPPAANVLHHVLERAQQVADGSNSTRYVYEKHAVTAELDADLNPTKSTEKVFKVMLISGLPFQRLVKIQGRDLTAQELEKENQRENKFRQRISGVDLNKKAARREALVTRELLDRFEFTVVRREVLRARPSFVLTFHPKAGLPEKTIEQKLLNRFTGTLWVDAEDYEVAKVAANMQGAVNIGWLGAVGSLHRCDISLERTRLPEGVWANLKSSFFIVARKLFTALRFRTTEDSSGFHQEP